MSKPVPRYWWDFVHDRDGRTITALIVQGDQLGMEQVAIFAIDGGNPRAAEYAIIDAEKLIDDLKSGRVSLKAVQSGNQS